MCAAGQPKPVRDCDRRRERAVVAAASYEARHARPARQHLNSGTRDVVRLGDLFATPSAWFLPVLSLLLARGAGPRGGTNDDGSVAPPAIQSGSTHPNASISHHHNPPSQAGHLRQGRPSQPASAIATALSPSEHSGDVVPRLAILGRCSKISTGRTAAAVRGAPSAFFCPKSSRKFNNRNLQMVAHSMNAAYSDRGSHECFAIRLSDAMYPARKS